MHCPVRSKRDQRRASVFKLLAVVAAAGGIALATSGRANTGMADWEHDWVALTIARNGTWGAAISGNLTRAMMQAIRDCSAKSGPVGNDCGAEITTVRAAWSLAYACGDYTFIANGMTTAEARTAAIHRALDLTDILGLRLPPCALLVGLGPDGRMQPAGLLSEVLPVIGTDR